MTGEEKPTVYLAGPIHHSQDHGMGWRARLKKDHDVFEWSDPTDAYDPKKTYGEIVQDWSNEDIVMKDLELIEECDAILVHWENVVVVGTPMEVVYAVQVFEIPVVVQTTVDDVPIWLDVHADDTVETFKEAIESLSNEISRRADSQAKAEALMEAGWTA